MQLFLDIAEYLKPWQAVLPVVAASAGVAGLLARRRTPDARGRNGAQVAPRGRGQTAAAAAGIDAAPAVRLGAGFEIGRLRDVMQRAQRRTETIDRNQASAAIQIDAAEIALDRLLADIAGVVAAPVVTPRPVRRDRQAAQAHGARQRPGDVLAA